MKTTHVKKEDVDKSWVLIDADGKVLGRLATEIAKILRGKNKVIFSPHVDTGDFVIIINADKIRLTGNKLDQKAYYRHSGYPGGLKKEVAKDIMKNTPERLIISAVKGMLPKNKLGRQQLSKLKVYKGSDHPHEAQSPEALNLNIQ